MLINNETYLQRFVNPIIDIETLKYDLSRVELDFEVKKLLLVKLDEALQKLEIAKLIVNDLNTQLSEDVKRKFLDSFKDSE